MAIVSKNQDPDPGSAPPDPNAPAAEQPKKELRHNLPLRTSPVVGRKPEMQRIVQIFERIRREGGPRRVEVVGPPGVGASSVAIELARRAGHRFPGGAWYVHLGMGIAVAWATLGAMRDEKPVTDLATAARSARERLSSEPKALLVLDGATSLADLEEALPDQSDAAAADVFVVAEKPLGSVDPAQVCEVSPVPRHGARRIALAMARHGQPDAKPPAVRTLDGLALTASLAARAALAYQGKFGPLSFDDTKQAVMRVIQLVARNGAALEMLLLASVAHPVNLPLDAIALGLAKVREGRGPAPTPEETATGAMWLAHAGILEPLDERHFSMHPIVQQVVHGLTRTESDLEIAREALATGLAAEAEASVIDGGVDLPRAAPHQLRHLAATAKGDAQRRVAEALARVEAAVAGGGGPATT